MEKTMVSDFVTRMVVEQSAQEVFKMICDVPRWWSEDFKGDARKLNDEFSVQFEDVHFSKQKVTELVPNKKITWLVKESNLSFLKNKSEWNKTSISFEISQQDDQTVVVFTHHGLVPEIECFGDCSNGWKYYLQKSLLPLIKSGKGNPHIKGQPIA